MKHYSTRLKEWRTCVAQEPALCSASSGNEFGVEMPHFENMEDARNFHESLLEKKYGVIATVKNKKNIKTEPETSFAKQYEASRSNIFAQLIDDSNPSVYNRVRLQSYTDEEVQKAKDDALFVSSFAKNYQNTNFEKASPEELNRLQQALSNTFSQMGKQPPLLRDHNLKHTESINMIQEAMKSVVNRYEDTLNSYEAGTIDHIKSKNRIAKANKEHEEKLKRKDNNPLRKIFKRS